ncbi:hypothetical protein AXG93_242s1420 [Marchantia polymorpha subsp. ruderalis]|uniref:Uncharacterized protein n=1 Tax=Marchantia polymorpha subsp. ruderalis TaxID=1480154 RepID=A0A176VLY0_MARPO|nr:hypothetical protein AXG93_242s1420 [Marchantia polymorpha subsp. ruderalis]
MRNVELEGEEVVLANEVNSDLEGEPLSSPQQRRKRPRGRQDSQPRKKRRINEAIVEEVRLQRTALIAMRAPDFRVWSKMKTRKKSCIEEDRSTSVEKSLASRKDKGKAILTEDVPLKRRDLPKEKIQREGPRVEAVEVLTVSSDTEEDPVALEEAAAKGVEVILLFLESAQDIPLKISNEKKRMYAYLRLNRLYI